MLRFQRIDPFGYPKLQATDECYHLGEYTSHGGWKASETNRQILNLQKGVNANDNERYYKERAVQYWANSVSQAVDLDWLAQNATLVPAPASKPAGHPEHDDRMLRLLRVIAGKRAGIDVRPLIVTTVERPSQRDSGRQDIMTLAATMTLDPMQLTVPLRSRVFVVDDVFTQGGTFKAVQSFIAHLPGVTMVSGIFLAKTVWPVPAFEDETL